MAGDERLTLSPQQTFEALKTVAERTARARLFTQAVLGVIAGGFVAAGVTVYALVGGGLSPQTRADEPGLYLLVASLFGKCCHSMALLLCAPAPAVRVQVATLT